MFNLNRRKLLDIGLLAQIVNSLNGLSRKFSVLLSTFLIFKDVAAQKLGRVPRDFLSVSAYLTSGGYRGRRPP